MLSADRIVPLLSVIAVHLGLIVWLNTALVQAQPSLALEVPIITGVLLAPPVPKPVVKPAPKPEPLPVVKPEPTPLPKIEMPPPEQTTPTEAPPALAVTPTETEEPVPGPTPVIPPRVDASHLDNPVPTYPAVSRRLGEQGEVLFDVYILPDGSVGEIRLKKSSGYARLDAVAQQAVSRWRYVPATRGGEPIAYWYVQPVVFSLRHQTTRN